MMATPNPAEPRCVDGCQTFIGHSGTGYVQCPDCGNPPLSEAQLLNRDALKVIEQFLPNIGKCFGVDMQLLNETLIGLRKP